MTSNATPAVFVLSSVPIWGTSTEEFGISTVTWTSDTEVWGTSTLVWGDAVALWGGLSGLVSFVIVGIPELVAERSLAGTTVTLKVTNSDLGNTGVRYWQAEGIQSNFVFLDNSSSPGTDFEITGIGVNAGTDYKFKATFTINGTINGNPVEVVGIRCAPVYVIAPTNTV